MIAVDTNVVVRLLMGDDLKQSKAARALFEERHQAAITFDRGLVRSARKLG